MWHSQSVTLTTLLCDFVVWYACELATYFASKPSFWREYAFHLYNYISLSPHKKVETHENITDRTKRPYCYEQSLSDRLDFCHLSWAENRLQSKWILILVTKKIKRQSSFVCHWCTFFNLCCDVVIVPLVGLTSLFVKPASLSRLWLRESS